MLPLYYYGSDNEAQAFYTIPWWRKKRPDGSGFSALIPVYYHGHSDYGSSFYSLPWLRRTNADDTGWHTSFPLYFHNRSAQASSFYSLVWSANRSDDGSGWDTTIPLYYRSFSTNGSAFYSLLWNAQSHPDGVSWNAAFPFYYGARSSDGSVMVTPFYARKLHDDGSMAWRCYIPLVYVNEDYDSHFMTLLGGRWRLGDRESWIALPLLSGGTQNADAGRNIYLAGVGGHQWDGEESSHYVFPLYYRAPYSKSLVSLPYSTWNDGQRQYSVIPPLLSGWYTEDDLSRALILAGLTGYRCGGDHPYHYVLPLYYSAPNDGNFFSLPYSRWGSGNRSNHLVLPLLSGWYTGEDSSGGTYALGLAGFRSGGAYSYHYAFPLYYSAPETGSFLSIPYATWRSGTRRHHTIPPLLSGWSEAPESTDYLLLGGLAYWRKGLDQVDASHLVPFYMWSRDEYFYSVLYGRSRQKSYYFTPLAGRYENGSGRSGSWLIPLYWHRRSLSSDEVEGYYFPLGYYKTGQDRTNHGFWGLYDYDRWTRPAESEQEVRESKRLTYFLAMGKSTEDWTYSQGESHERKLRNYRKGQSFFPLWHRRIKENLVSQRRLETSSVLGILYDTRHEEEVVDGKDHDYFRRRILRRVFHYEKLNGDVSTDIFPGITVDSYKNGYYKLSFMWRLFRYENDPQSGKKELDLLFLPLKR